MKFKPAVKNELFLEDVITFHHENKGQTLRVAVQWDDMIIMQVHNPTSEEYKDTMIMLDKEQVEQLILLYNEWKNEYVEPEAAP